jgi:death-on-curing protein
MKKLSLEEVEYIAHRLAKEHMDFDEPLPAFRTRYPGKLESCLEQPFQTFGGKELYPKLVNKATILFYLITKNHPFENGNKRMAITTTMVFLFKNGCWLFMSWEQLYKVALAVARCPKIKERKNIFEHSTKQTCTQYIIGYTMPRSWKLAPPE